MKYKEATGYDIGKNNRLHYLLLACQRCGVKRWVNKYKRSRLCARCSHLEHGIQMVGKWTGESHGSWKGGRCRVKYGYILVWVSKPSPYDSMRTPRGYIPEHRLVMAKYLGRPLKSWEIVHHKNGIKDDNRLENLELLPKYAHDQQTKLEMEIAKLQNRVILLEAEVCLLKSEDVVRLSESKK